MWGQDEWLPVDIHYLLNFLSRVSNASLQWLDLLFDYWGEFYRCCAVLHCANVSVKSAGAISEVSYAALHVTVGKFCADLHCLGGTVGDHICYFLSVFVGDEGCGGCGSGCHGFGDVSGHVTRIRVLNRVCNPSHQVAYPIKVKLLESNGICHISLEADACQKHCLAIHIELIISE